MRPSSTRVRGDHGHRSRCPSPRDRAPSARSARCARQDHGTAAAGPPVRRSGRKARTFSAAPLGLSITKRAGGLKVRGIDGNSSRRAGFGIRRCHGKDTQTCRQDSSGDDRGGGGPSRRCPCGREGTGCDGRRLHRGGQLLRNAEHPFGRQSGADRHRAGAQLRPDRRNASPGSLYLIRVPGADRSAWVAFGCGRVEDDSQSRKGARPSSGGEAGGGRGRSTATSGGKLAASLLRDAAVGARVPDGRGGRQRLLASASGPSRADASIAAFPRTCADGRAGRMAPPAGLRGVGRHAPCACRGDAGRPVGSRPARMVGARHLLQGRRRNVLSEAVRLLEELNRSSVRRLFDTVDRRR